MRLRLLHVASGALPPAEEAPLARLARALHGRDDLQLHLTLLHHGPLAEHLRAEGLNVEVLDGAKTGSLRRLHALKKRVAALRPHLVHSHCPEAHLLAALAARGTQALALRTIGDDRPSARSLRAHAAQLADTVSAHLQQAAVCLSHGFVEGARRRYPWLELEVIEDGIELHHLLAAARAVDETRLGPHLRIGFVGPLVQDHRPDLFVAAAHHLHRALPGRFSFYLFGAGPLRAACADFVQRHGLEGRVRIVDTGDEPAWLARMDGLVVCPDREGLFPEAAQAMVLGVPVVARALPGLCHILGFGRYGMLVRDHSPDGYADALREMAENPHDTLLRARRARAHAQIRFAMEAVAERYVAFYRQLLAAPESHRRFVYD